MSAQAQDFQVISCVVKEKVMRKYYANDPGSNEFNILMFIFLCICLFVIGRNLYSSGEGNKMCDFTISGVPTENQFGYHVKCHGGNDGKATVKVTGTGNYNFKWTAPDFESPEQSVTGLKAGLYKVEVTDEKGCTVRDSMILFQPPAITVTEMTYPTNPGEALGEANVFASGGISPYLYEWQTIPVQRGNTAIGLKEGVYTVLIRDRAGCVIKHEVSIETLDIRGSK